jgi:hypothetical protein
MNITSLKSSATIDRRRIDIVLIVGTTVSLFLLMKAFLLLGAPAVYVEGRGFFASHSPQSWEYFGIACLSFIGAIICGWVSRGHSANDQQKKLTVFSVGLFLVADSMLLFMLM